MKSHCKFSSKSIWIPVFWDMIKYHWVGVYQHSAGLWSKKHQGPHTPWCSITSWKAPNPLQRTSNLTMTTFLEKAIPLHCMLLHAIINCFLQLNKLQFQSRSAQHSMLFLPHSTTKNFLGNILHYHNLNTVRKPNNGGKIDECMQNQSQTYTRQSLCDTKCKHYLHTAQTTTEKSGTAGMLNMLLVN